MFKNLVILPVIALIIVLAGCETTNNNAAIDAAIAVNIVQGVVAPETCGIGGDLFALIWIDGEDKPYCLDSSGYAGSNVENIDFTGLKSLPLNHEATVSVPGAVRGWSEMNKKFGNPPKPLEIHNKLGNPLKSVEINSKTMTATEQRWKWAKSNNRWRT